MTKYTKRQYKKDLAANDAEKILNDAWLASFEYLVEQGLDDCLTIGDYWNAAHDAAYDIEDERFDIERRFSRRNWTWQDWSEYELVSQNID